jgi:hypothetical protein
MSTLDERRAALKRRHKLPELDRRREATQATVDKFKGLPFDWSEGRHCVRMAHFHLRQMGWRSPELPTIPRVRSPLAAKKALKDKGFDSVTEWLDSILERIPPAMMLLGDIAVTPGDHGLDAILICTGDRGVLGWLPDGSEAVVMLDCNLDDITGAWRVR